MSPRAAAGTAVTQAGSAKKQPRVKPGGALVEVEGRQLALSNLEKVYYPATGYTKGQVLDYYTRIAPAMLPHLKGRHLTLKRFPEGVDGLFFYEKRCPAHRPPWVTTAKIWSPGNNDHMYFCVLNDLPTLLWAVNLGALELHTPLSKARANLKPDFIAFDFDPGAPADITQCCQVAIRVRALLEQLGLESFAKISGSKGLQMYVPLNVPGITFDHTKTFARAVALALEQETPDQVVSNMKKVLRKGKVFIDWSQNDDHKTTVCVYSMRAKPEPSASAPVTWDEVAAVAKSGKTNLLKFTPEQVVQRYEKQGDLFAPVLTLKQKLPKQFGG